MKTKMIRIILVVVVLGFAGIAKATIVDICLATNKPVYDLGEEVVVFVIAYNPNPEPVTLSFSSTLVATYLIDSVFNWSEHRQFAQIPTGARIEPYDSCTWNLSHDSRAMMIYPLDVGFHTVVGEVVGYGQSAPVEFEVVPEPSTLLLFAIGLIETRRRRPIWQRQL
jgi:hypothetical protein